MNLNKIICFIVGHRKKWIHGYFGKDILECQRCGDRWKPWNKNA